MKWGRKKKPMKMLLPTRPIGPVRFDVVAYAVEDIQVGDYLRIYKDMRNGNWLVEKWKDES